MGLPVSEKQKRTTIFDGEKMSMDREPCPFRIVEDAGNAFMFGLVGSGIWNIVGGIRNAPSGHRIAQAVSRIKARAPLTAGGFAIWGMMYSICDCTIASIRKKEDPWNAIASGAATGGILAIRGGYKLAAKNAAMGGAILAVIEGLQIGISKLLMPYIEEKSKQNGFSLSDQLEPPVDILYSSGSISNQEPMAQPSPVYNFNNGDFAAENNKWSSKSS